MLGAGRVTQAITRHALATEHEVIFSNRRGPDSLSEVVAALGRGASQARWPKQRNGTRGVWAALAERCNEPNLASEPEMVFANLGGRGSSEIVATLAPGARVVKAFNSMTMDNFEEGPKHGDARRVAFISGDEADAKEKVRTLIAQPWFRRHRLGRSANRWADAAGWSPTGADEIS
jgi:predicted dinucleotide-binding enzyme